MTNDQPPGIDSSQPPVKVRLPGTILLVVGILNSLCALLLIASSIGVLNRTPEDWAQDDIGSNLLKDGWTVEQVRRLALSIDIGGGTVILTAATVTILGAIKMRALRSHTLAVAGAVFAAIPCLSPASCCGLGEAIGIWAVLVLLRPEVKSNFH